jgi:predicted negative regulator of RcsB-dependent stress response
MLKVLTTILLILCAIPALADSQPVACTGADKACLLKELDASAGSIGKTEWRDQTRRELAKLLAHNKQPDDAIALIDRIETPDTKAMTIRGIGMAAAEGRIATPELFTKLRKEADKITDPPSHAIALTYIAMSQAFADDDAGAMATAQGMENAALRNKAHNEAAKIQADRGDYNAAIASIAAIEDPAFRDKAHGIISGIFADHKKYDEAVLSADKITDTYKKSQAILYILAKQITPREVSIGNDTP